MNHQVSEPENHSERKDQTSKKKTPKWLYVVLGLLLVAVIIAIYYVYSVLDFFGAIHKDPGDSRFNNYQSEDDGLPPKWEGTDRVNILLLGGDSRGLGKNDPPRSDSMIVASIDPVTKKAHLFSILRDTYGAIPGHGNDRINSALILGGPQLAMKTVSEVTGLPVQYYVYTDFQGFIKLIDALGGIEFEVEKRMVWKDSHDDPIYHIDLQPGLQQLDGRTALAYVRFRHDAMSDYTRTERQRNFLSAIADKLKTTTSLVKLPILLKSVVPYLETNLGLEDMLKLSRLGFEVDTTSIASVQLPPTDLLVEQTIGGASVIGIRDQDQLLQYVQEQLLQSPVAEAEASEKTETSTSAKAGTSERAKTSTSERAKTSTSNGADENGKAN